MSERLFELFAPEYRLIVMQRGGGRTMTEPNLKRYFLQFEPKGNVYKVVDRQTGQAGMAFEDYTAALHALDVLNQEHADAEARARASGRPL